MFWKNKWENVGVKKKIFITNSILISMSVIALYMAIYVFMPQVYQRYRVNKIESNISTLKKTLNEDADADYEELLDEFWYSNNVSVVLFGTDANGQYSKMIYSSTRQNSKQEIISSANNPNDSEIGMNRDKIGKEPAFEGESKSESLNIENVVYIKSLEDFYLLKIHQSVKPRDEATTIVTLFFPFAILVGIIIALLISIYYSRVISKPLIKINEAAKKMAKLDFSYYLDVDGKDEIAQLSSSLNNMSKNLKENLEELESVNLKLTEDIEKERKIEKERREFIDTISHELKTPITIISGQIEGMIYGIGKYKDRDKYLREAYDVSQNMRDLVQELLQLSHRESDVMDITFEEFDINELLNNVITELNFLIDQKKLNLKIKLEDGVTVWGDKKLLKKVFVNIVKNAITYSPEGENIIITQENKKVTVENTGITIDENSLKEVFNPFYRVDKSRNRQTGGTGLGLYIVKTILDKHENIAYNIDSTGNSVVFTVEF